MRITELDALVLGTPRRTLTYIRLQTDEGLVGVGEANLPGRTETLLAYLREIRPLVIGMDPFETERFVRRITQGREHCLGEVVGTGVALVEIACWDLVGQALGVPIYRLLGGALRDRIKACAVGWSDVERTPEAFAAAARRALTKGYRVLKFDPFGQPEGDLSRPELHQGIRLAEAVRAAVGPDVELVIDLGGRLAPASALQIVRKLERIEPAWIEAPLSPGDARSLARARQQGRIAVAAGGQGFHRVAYRELFERQACDLVRPDPTHCCGLAETRRIAAAAETYTITVAPRHAAGPVATSVSLHLAATIPNLGVVEHPYDFDPEEILQGGDCAGQLGLPIKEAASGCPEVIDGYFLLPEGPGLGIRLNEDLIRAHAPDACHGPPFEATWHSQQAIQA